MKHTPLWATIAAGVLLAACGGGGDDNAAADPDALANMPARAGASLSLEPPAWTPSSWSPS